MESKFDGICKITNWRNVNQFQLKTYCKKNNYDKYEGR